MKIIIVGATGTIGSHVYNALSKNHEVIKASANKGEIKVDITSADSIKQMFEKTGGFDALICTAGGGHVGPFESMTEEDFYKGIRSKMMGQINLVLTGQHYINPGGSFTLTSGILTDDPIRMGTNLTVINSAVNAFVMAASYELKNDVRINAVSPALVEDSVSAMGQLFPGHVPATMQRVTMAYVKSVEGIINGQVIKVY